MAMYSGTSQPTSFLSFREKPGYKIRHGWTREGERLTILRFWGIIRNT
jgi:hypothetical protein